MQTLNALKGVGPQTLKKLNAAGIFEPEDLISIIRLTITANSTPYLIRTNKDSTCEKP